MLSPCRKVAEVTGYMYAVLWMTASFRSSARDL